MPLRHERLGQSNHEQLRDDVVAALRRGELCVLPTETVYGLACLPSNPDAAKLASSWKGRDATQPFTWHLADPVDIGRLDAKVTEPAKRLIDRYWPGPLTVILPSADGTGGKDGKTVGVRQPAHEFTRSVIEACGEPLWLTSVNASGEPPLIDPEEIAKACQEGVSIFVDDGPSPIGSASTIVKATGGALQVLREGILSRDEVMQTAADVILFVCTGNTCRSPLAEAMAREVTAQAMGVAESVVLARGIHFASAGTATVPGMGASDGSLAAADEIGLDLTSHISQPITPELWQRAIKIYCLGDSHRRALLAEAPEIADKIELLRPDGLDIADPYGGDLQVYQRARDEMRAAVIGRMGDWWP